MNDYAKLKVRDNNCYTRALKVSVSVQGSVVSSLFLIFIMEAFSLEFRVLKSWEFCHHCYKTKRAQEEIEGMENCTYGKRTEDKQGKDKSHALSTRYSKNEYQICQIYLWKVLAGPILESKGVHAIFQKMGKTRANVFTCDYCMQQTARIGSDWPGVGAVSILFTSHKNRYTSNVLVTKEGWTLLRTMCLRVQVKWQVNRQVVGLILL